MDAGGGTGGEPGLGPVSWRATVPASRRAVVLLLIKPVSAFSPLRVPAEHSLNSATTAW